MMELVLKSFYFILPAYAANMAPVIFLRAGWLLPFNVPIDGGKKWGRDFVFGQNKTWLGLVSAVIASVAVVAIQTILYQFEPFYNISLLNYVAWFLPFGVLAGLGVILGDLTESFVKRRIGIKSGKSWPVFDQWDFVVGFFVFTYWLVKPGWPIIAMIFILTIILHPLTNLIGYLLKIKKVWW